MLIPAAPTIAAAPTMHEYVGMLRHTAEISLVTRQDVVGLPSPFGM